MSKTERHEERHLTKIHSFIPILICVCVRVCVCVCVKMHGVLAVTPVDMFHYAPYKYVHERIFMLLICVYVFHHIFL